MCASDPGVGPGMSQARGWSCACVRLVEELNGTDPFRADPDGDTVPDGSDAYPLDPTRSLPPSSNPSDTTPPVITFKEPVSAQLIP